MDRVPEEHGQEELSIGFINGMLLDILRVMLKWTDAKEVDLDILINRMNPIDRGAREKKIRELDLVELALHAHYMGVADKLKELYLEETQEAMAVLEVMSGIRTAIFAGASRDVKLEPGDTHFTGLRREHGKAIWVERQPDFRESLEAMALKLRHRDPDEGGE